MIELNITASDDIDILGQYLTYADKITLGKKSDADLIINDHTLSPHHLTFELINSQLRLTPTEGAIFWLNEKKSIGPKNAKIGDSLKIGTTTMKVVSFVMSPWNNKSPLTPDQKFNHACETDPVRSEILENLKIELDKLEWEASHVSKNAR